MKIIINFLAITLIAYSGYVEAISDKDCSKSDNKIINITVSPKRPQLITNIDAKGNINYGSSELLSYKNNNTPVDPFFGIPGFLYDEATAMAIDLVEQEFVNSLCDSNNVVSSFLPRTCKYYKVNNNFNSMSQTPNLSWIPAQIKEDLKYVPACIYRNAHPNSDQTDTGSLDGYVLTEALAAINDGNSIIQVIAGIQDQLESKSKCSKSIEPGCWLYYSSVLAHAQQSQTDKDIVDENNKKIDDGKLLCLKFKSFFKVNIDDKLNCETKNADFSLLSRLILKFDKYGSKYNDPSLTEDARRYLASNFITDITSYFSKSGLSIFGWSDEQMNEQIALNKWLALFGNYSKNNYEQAALILMNDIGCVLNQDDKKNPNGHGIDNKNDTNLCGTLVFIGSVAQAKNSDDIKKLLEETFDPIHAWRRRSSQTIVDFGSVVGIQDEQIRTNSNGTDITTHGYGISAPVGFSVTTPVKDFCLLPNGIYGLMFPLLDFGSVLTYSESQQSASTTVSSQQSWKSVIAPGVFLRWQPISAPIVLLVGYEWSNAVSQYTLADGSQHDVGGRKLMISMGIDLSLLPIISH